jgi:large subunit ribosomal protein L18
MSTKELKAKQANTIRRAFRTRTRLHGTSVKPRLSVQVSLHHVAAQLINDDDNRTIVGVSTVGQKLTGKTMTEKAAWVGAEIAAKAKAAAIEQAIFDRGAKKYHGRIAALADAAREKGLKI